MDVYYYSTKRCHSRLYSSEKGQSLAEFVVSLAFFVPIFIGIPLVGKYADIKHKNIEASRYAVWERTVWSDPAARWNDGEQTKTDDQLQNEIILRLYGHPQEGIKISQTKNRVNNPLWVNRKGDVLIKKGSGKVDKDIQISVNEISPPGMGKAVKPIAHDGIPLLRNINKLTNLVNKSIGIILSDCRDIPGVDFNKGLDLGSKNYVNVEVKTKAINYLMKKGDLVFTSKAGILSNAWTAPNEKILRERIDRLVFDEAVRCLASPARLISIVPIFKEGKNARKIEGSVSSNILLKEYKGP
jgi:hypothetical protein